ncbi:hypothetical protein GCM10023238_04190 [Streptomyces heliomycini]
MIMLAGLQGAGKTTLAGKLGRWLRSRATPRCWSPADLQRPTAVNQLSVVAERAGVAVYAPEPGQRAWRPGEGRQDSVEFAKTKVHDIGSWTPPAAWGIDQEMMRQARGHPRRRLPGRDPVVVDAMIGQDAVNTAEAFRDGVGFDGVVLSKLDGDARGGAAHVDPADHRQAIMFASNGAKLDDFDAFHPDRMALPASSTWAHCSP